MDKISSCQECLQTWENNLANYLLPKWDELPNFDLYMDQVISLISQYLTVFPHDPHEQVITASTINNYVRLKLMPAPYKKRYTKIHLAYILMICTLKQNMSIADIQKMLPLNLPADEIPAFYDHYVDKYARASMYFLEQVKILEPKDDLNSIKDFISQGAIIAGLIQILNAILLPLCFDEAPESKKNAKK